MKIFQRQFLERIFLKFKKSNYFSLCKNDESLKNHANEIGDNFNANEHIFEFSEKNLKKFLNFKFPPSTIDLKDYKEIQELLEKLNEPEKYKIDMKERKYENKILNHDDIKENLKKFSISDIDENKLYNLSSQNQIGLENNSHENTELDLENENFEDLNSIHNPVKDPNDQLLDENSSEIKTLSDNNEKLNKIQKSKDERVKLKIEDDILKTNIIDKAKRLEDKAELGIYFKTISNNDSEEINEYFDTNINLNYTINPENLDSSNFISTVNSEININQVKADQPTKTVLDVNEQTTNLKKKIVYIQKPINNSDQQKINEADSQNQSIKENVQQVEENFPQFLVEEKMSLVNFSQNFENIMFTKSFNPDNYYRSLQYDNLQNEDFKVNETRNSYVFSIQNKNHTKINRKQFEALFKKSQKKLFNFIVYPYRSNKSNQSKSFANIYVFDDDLHIGSFILNFGDFNLEYTRQSGLMFSLIVSKILIEKKNVEKVNVLCHNNKLDIDKILISGEKTSKTEKPQIIITKKFILQLPQVKIKFENILRKDIVKDSRIHDNLSLEFGQYSIKY